VAWFLVASTRTSSGPPGLAPSGAPPSVTCSRGIRHTEGGGASHAARPAPPCVDAARGSPYLWDPRSGDPRVKPADHPEFFLRPPPPGRSRESTLRLDREGRFWHDGRRVEHPGMARSFAAWMDRHPVDGRFILNNGYDWTYLEVEDAPCHVRTLYGRPASAPAPSAPAPSAPAPSAPAPSGDGHPEQPWLEPAAGSQEPLAPSTRCERAR